MEILQEIAAEMAAILVDDFNFKKTKVNKPPTNPKTVVSEEYHDLLDIFSKKTFNTMTIYFKYNHKI